MTIIHFLGLDKNRQAAIASQGEFLACRNEGCRKMLLYRVYDFYAEVVYDAAAGRITSIKGFNARTHLLPYGL